MMSENDSENISIGFYKDYTNSLEQALQANQKSYDHSILTLSSGSIAALLTLVQTRPHLDYKFLFFISITFFVIAIFSTLFSYILVPKAIEEKSTRAYQYYVEGDQSVLLLKSCAEKTISILNISAGTLFILGGIFAISYISSNF